MSSTLLSCRICPKQPEFSDVSHLLTHVSSKGHLAHLHKLQVRSHQEIAAGVQLANYNQWYQQHGLGQLLSERMLMKEAKQASKRAQDGVVKRDDMDVKNESHVGANRAQSSPVRQVTRNRARNRAKRAKRHLTVDEDDSDLDYSPIQGYRRLPKTSYLITPVKKTPLPSSPPPVDDLPEIDPELVTPPKNAKLKGKVWPGMDLFDAATPEEARRRNQRKDGSVVKRMERLSKLVEPTETVYTRDGTMRKQRNIDDLEDNSSLIEGETPVIKSKPRSRPKQKPLKRVSANLPRLVQRKARATQGLTARRGRDQTALPQIVRIPSSSRRTTYGLQSRYSPTEEENVEFKLAISNLPLRKRAGNFAIFTDSPTAYPPRMPTYPSQRMPLNQTYNVPMPQRLVFPNLPWLQPQNQNPLYHDNGYNHRSVYSNFPEFQDMGVDKENVMPAAGRMDSQATNPLTWPSPMPDTIGHCESSDSTFGTFSGYFGGTSIMADPFGYDENPLADALEAFAVSQNIDPIKLDEKAVENSNSGDVTQEQTNVAVACR